MCEHPWVVVGVEQEFGCCIEIIGLNRKIKENNWLNHTDLQLWEEMLHLRNPNPKRKDRRTTKRAFKEKLGKERNGLVIKVLRLS